MSPSRTVIPSAAFIVVVVIAVLLDHLGSAQAQNYHYSNGWHPGKRGDVADLSQTALYHMPSTDRGCEDRQRVLRLISDLITDEIARLDKRCSSDDSFDLLKMLTEPSQAALVGRRRNRKQNAEEGREEGEAGVIQW